MGAHTRGSRRASHVRLRWAVAAGLGATVCVAAWLAVRGAGGSGVVTPDRPIASGSGVGTGSAGEPAPGGTSVVASAGDAEAEVEAMFLASSLLDTGFDSEIDAIATSAASLGLTLTDPLSGLSETTWAQGTSEGNSL